MRSLSTTKIGFISYLHYCYDREQIVSHFIQYLEAIPIGKYNHIIQFVDLHSAQLSLCIHLQSYRSKQGWNDMIDTAVKHGCGEQLYLDLLYWMLTKMFLNVYTFLTKKKNSEDGGGTFEKET